MEAKQLREQFLRFFAERGHTKVPSGNLVPHDPSLLFTVAGMVPFKSYFVGEEPAPWPRAVSVQKCVRAGGKHNDLDGVGRTNRHLTFFEMLGNFSFGDYFKHDAIVWSWEFSTEILGFDPDNIWITVHINDDEAAEIWRDAAGVAPDRIQRLDDDNYWRMGEFGPCGPCSELFFDTLPADKRTDNPGPAEASSLHTFGEDRYVEFWNLVFMQSEQRPDGLHPLPKPSIDTGAGLERLLVILQKVTSVFEIDEMARLVDKASEITAIPYGKDPQKDISLRIMAEHARAMTFLITDGVFPSNEDRGYVLRRIMRRAIRHAHLLGVERVACPEMVDEVVAMMNSEYPDLGNNHHFVREVVEREEERFRATLSRGMAILTDELGQMRAGDTLSGATAFQLHDTYGFPLELIEEAVMEQEMAVDVEGFNDEMSKQRERARKDRQDKLPQSEDLSAEIAILEEHGETLFVGREDSAVSKPTEAKVLLVTPQGVILDRTPFYAEAGGQVGDTGVLWLLSSDESSGDAASGEAASDNKASKDTAIRITDTTYVVPGIRLHHTAEAAQLSPGDSVLAQIDTDRRSSIRRHHTGTHLLHWALREALGDHVTQQGSWVGHDRLRFDFTHFQAVTDEEIQTIEDLVNTDVLANEQVRHFETTFNEAKSLGALSFFGDKYGDEVLVLEAGSHSLELCGGTHVKATGDIGLLKVISESSIGANIRRIEAICGTGVMDRLRQAENKLAQAAGILGVPQEDLEDSARKHREEIKSLRDELSDTRRQAAVGQAGDLAKQAEGGVLAAEVADIDKNDLRALAVEVCQKEDLSAVILGTAAAKGGVSLVASVAPDKGLHASEMLKDALKLVQGGGAENPDLAMGGGKNADKLAEALELARQTAKEQLAG